MDLSDARGAGRARSAIPIDDVGQASLPSPVWSRSGWHPEPAATCDEVAWSNPLVRTYVVNVLDDPTGPFAEIDAFARALMKQFLHHRNGKTGDLFPSCGLLAFELPFRERSIRYALGRLDTGSSRQRNGEIVEGLGLVGRRKRWRPYGGQTSNFYWFTQEFMVRAGLVLPHDPASCETCQRNAALRIAPPRRGRSRRPIAATLPLPMVPAAAAPSPPAAKAAPSDPDYETLALVFTAERAKKYGDHDAGTLREEKRAIVASVVLDMTAEACAWGESRGLDLDRAAVREDLCRHVARLWLAMPGTNELLLERRHPIGLMVGDLRRLMPEALGAWKRSQPRRAMPEQAELPLDEGRKAEAEELDAPPAITRDPSPGGDRAAARVKAVETHRVGLALTGDAMFDRAIAKTRAAAPASFDQWFVGVQFEGLAAGVLSLRVQNDFVRVWVEGKFLPALVGDLCAQIGADVEVRWAIDPDLSLPLVRPVSVESDSAPAAAPVEGTSPSEEHTPLGAAAAGESDAAAPAQESLVRGGYGVVNAPMAEFLREQSEREDAPSTRRGRSVRTRIALRSRPLGTAPPDAEEEAPASEASAAHPRRRHVRSRLGLPYEQAGAAASEAGPPDESAEPDPPPWDDGDRGDGPDEQR